MNRRSIPVFFSTDNNYAVPTYIAAYSMLKNCQDDFVIKIFVLVSEDFSKYNIDLLESLTKQFSFMELMIIDDFDSFRDFETNNQRISAATMYKLLIPNIVEQFHDMRFDKCIFLDSDIVVEGNIADLFNNDLDENYIGGVRDRLLSGEGQRELGDKLKLPSFDNYVNAGVLLFNIKEFRSHIGLSKALEEAGYRKDFPYNDQDALNTVCYGRIKVLPLKFNINTFCLHDRDPEFYAQYGLSNIIDARKNPVIIHYNTRKKPWMLKHIPMAGKWWKYVRMQDKKIKELYLRPFLTDNRAPLFDSFIEGLKTFLIYMGIYNQFKKAFKSRHV